MSTSTRSVYMPSATSPFGTFDPGNATVENGVQRRNSSFVPRITLPVTNSAEPKSSSRPKSAKFTSARIRSNSGLSHHLQALDLKQYTEYLPDGSPKSPMYGLSGSSSHSLTDTSTESVHLTPSFVQTVSESELPIQDIQGREALDAAMKNPDTANKLWRLAASQGSEDKVEFLMKVHEYTQSLETVVAQLSDISTTHTSVAATTPLGLPAQLSRSLNTNLKHLASSLLPGLENLFLEPKEYIEQRLARDIFPAFVKQQLTSCAAMGLILDADPENPASHFGGLGTAFCLADPNLPGCPLTFMSDGFEQITGYSRQDMLGRVCSFLQGPATDEMTISRIRQAVEKKEECLEIILNYRKDGSAFWNMLYLLPLVDPNGRLRHVLGAQMDVSSFIRGHKDLQRLFTYDPIAAARKRERVRGEQDQDQEREDLFKFQNAAEKGSKMNFFKQFKKTSSGASLTDRSFDKFDFGSRHDTDKTTMRTVPLGLNVGEEMLKPYNRFMLLNLSATALSSPSSSSFEKDMSTSEGFLGKLTVSYCTQEAIDIFGLGVTRDAVMQKDIFQLLYEYGNSPSINKTFRSSVRNAVLRDGKSISIELSISKVCQRRAGFDRRGSHTDNSEMSRITKSKAAAKGGERNDFERLMSHWAPMKGAEGEDQLVLLILSPSLI